MPQRVDVPVIVAGGGPVGLVAALALAEAGFEALVLERDHDAVRAEWRGSTLHPPTLEILDRLALATDVVAGGTRVDRLQYRDLEFGDVAEFDYSVLAGLTRFPFRLQFEQYKLLRLLRAAAAGHPGLSVAYGHDIIGVTQDDDGVDVTVDTGGNTTVLSCSWLVGADGSHSTVRKLLDIDFSGWTYPTQSLVVATSFRFEDRVNKLGPVVYWSGPEGRLSLIRTPDTWRAALSTQTSADCAGGGTVDAPHPAFRSAMSLLLGSDWRDAKGLLPLLQHQLYRSHQRVASTFRSGRVVLAGDAAHVSSTTGGMGLNSGVQDAWALAWALSEHGHAGLARYADVRRQAATGVVQPSTAQVRAGVDVRDAHRRRNRLAELRRIASAEQPARHYLATVSMLESATSTPQ